jgi:hypothetical protein
MVCRGRNFDTILLGRRRKRRHAMRSIARPSGMFAQELYFHLYRKGLSPLEFLWSVRLTLGPKCIEAIASTDFWRDQRLLSAL